MYVYIFLSSIAFIYVELCACHDNFLSFLSHRYSHLGSPDDYDTPIEALTCEVAVNA